MMKSHPLGARALSTPLPSNAFLRGALLAAALHATPSLAFKVVDVHMGPLVFSGLPVHEAITRNALSGMDVILGNGAAIRFHTDALKSVEDANHRTDSKEWDKPEVHFDDESFSLAVTRLAALKDSIVRDARGKSYGTARELLGEALHSVQDFYAHTNFVETFSTSPLPDLGSRPTLDLKAAPVGTPSCSAQGLTDGGLLTSGYFVLPQAVLDLGWTTTQWKTAAAASGYLLAQLGAYPLIVGSSALWLPTISTWPQDKCVHGNDEGSGLNKDVLGRPLHSEARTAATTATSKFVALVLADLRGNDTAICGLLGQEQAHACGTPAATAPASTRPPTPHAGLVITNERCGYPAFSLTGTLTFQDNGEIKGAGCFGAVSFPANSPYSFVGTSLISVSSPAGGPGGLYVRTDVGPAPRYVTATVTWSPTVPQSRDIAFNRSLELDAKRRIMQWVNVVRHRRCNVYYGGQTGIVEANGYVEIFGSEIRIMSAQGSVLAKTSYDSLFPSGSGFSEHYRIATSGAPNGYNVLVGGLGTHINVLIPDESAMGRFDFIATAVLPSGGTKSVGCRNTAG